MSAKPAKITLAALAALLLAALAFSTVYFPARATRNRDQYQLDIFIRYNEIKCLRQGTEPYDVWKGNVKSDDFASMRYRRRAHPAQELVHAHMPWEYTMLYPITLLPKDTAKLVYFTLNSLLYLALLAWGVRFALRHNNKNAAAALFVTALAFGFNIWMWKGALFFGNYGAVFCALIIAIAALMRKDDAAHAGASCAATADSGAPAKWPRLARVCDWCGGFGRHQLLAGLAIAVMMNKPQVGPLFCVTLLIYRKFAAVAAGAVICVLLSIPPAIMCGKTPWDMIINAMSGGADHYHGSAFITLNRHLGIIEKYNISADTAIHISMGIGLAILVALSFMLRRSDDWFEKLTPPILIAPMWTYSVPHDIAMWTIPAIWMLVCKARDWRGRTLAMLILAVAAVACYRGAWDWFKIWYTHWHTHFHEHYAHLGIFTKPANLGKTAFWWRYYDNGMGHNYKQAVLAIFCAWAAFRAWRLKVR